MVHHHGRLFIVTTACVLLGCLFSFACKKSLGDRWVYAAAGIDIYAAPDTKSPLVTHVPVGEKVEALQEKDGAPGSQEKWVELKWNDKTGWAHAGGLTKTEGERETPQAESSFPAETIIPLPELEAAAKAFYENNLKKALGELQDQMIALMVDKLHKYGYAVKYRVGDFAVVKHGESFGGPPTDINTYSHADALWRKKDGKWIEVIPNGGWGDQMYLYQMNNDEFPDVLVKRCVSDLCSLFLHLGKADGTFQEVGSPGDADEITFPDYVGPVMKIGKCGGTSVDLTVDGKKVHIEFDCEKNLLVKTVK